MSSGRTVLEQAAADIEDVVTGLERAQLVVSRERMPIAGAAKDLDDPEFEQQCRAAFARMFAPDGNVWVDLGTALQVIGERRDRCQGAIDWCDALFDECDRLDALYPRVMGHVAEVKQLIDAAPVGEKVRTWTADVFGGLPGPSRNPRETLPPWTDFSRIVDEFLGRKRALEECRAELSAIRGNLAKVMDFRRPVRQRVMRVQGLVADPGVSEAAWRRIRPHVDRVVAYVSHEQPSDFWADLHRLIDVLRAEAVS